MIFLRKELERLVTVKPGTIINQEVLNKNVEAIKTKIGDYGYALPM